MATAFPPLSPAALEWAREGSDAAPPLTSARREQLRSLLSCCMDHRQVTGQRTQAGSLPSVAGDDAA